MYNFSFFSIVAGFAGFVVGLIIALNIEAQLISKFVIVYVIPKVFETIGSLLYLIFRKKDENEE